LFNLSKTTNNEPLTPEAIEVRTWAFVVVMVTLVLVFIVAMLLYSVTFVTQPIKSMAPIDQAYTKMLNDIVLLIVGGIGGIMTKRVTKAITNQNTPPTQTNPPCVGSGLPQQVPNVYGASPVSFGSGQLPTWVNPALDESWTPGPPPTTPVDYLPPEHEEIAHERQAARSET
jgi:hypothetical protein